jgi:1-phosphatidylinositol-3-phosphate 5-kinase
VGSTSRAVSDGNPTGKQADVASLLYHHESIAAPTICPHTQAPRSWMFRRLTTIIRLSRESVKVLETRMPKLQIGPNVSKRKPGVDAAAQAVDSLLDPQETAELIEVTRREIEAFYVSLERLVAKLVSCTLPGSRLC